MIQKFLVRVLLLVMSFFVLMSTAKASQEHVISVASFSEWKSEQIQASLKKVTSLRQEIEQKKFRKLKITNDSIQALSDAKEQLRTTKEYGIRDYFIGYLSQYGDNQTALAMAALKLTPKQIGELMEAYASNLAENKNEKSKTEATISVGL